MINKIFHFIWLGESPLKKDYINYMASWTQKNPSWKVRIWTENNIPDLYNQELYENAETYAERADILRYELLYRYGGVYVDVDYECLDPINSLLDDTDFFVCLDAEDWDSHCKNYLNQALMGCTKQHFLMKEIVEELPLWNEMHQDQSVLWRTGPAFISYFLKDKDITVFPLRTFHGQYAEHFMNGSWQTDRVDGKVNNV